MSDGAAAQSQLTLPVPIDTLRWLAWNAGILIVYWMVLQYCYVHAVSPINSNTYYMYLKPNGLKETEGILWAMLLLPTVNTSWQRPSDFGLTILYYFALVPTLLIYGLADQPRSAMLMMLCGYAAAFAICRMPVRIPYFQLRQGARSSVYIAALGTLFILSWFAIKGNSTNFNIDLLDVYQYRDAAGDVFSFGPVAYVASWTPRVLNPFIMCYCLIRRRWFLFAISFAFQLACLIIFQEKSVFIPCVILPMLYFAPHGKFGRIALMMYMIATIVVCQAIYERYDFSLFSQLWTRRFFFDQQFAYFNYIDVFRHIGVVYYADSFLRGIVHYRFPFPPANMVGYYVLGSSLANDNTGFLGAGYMELGFAGIVLSGSLAGMVLRLFDQVTSPRLPMWFFGTVAYMAFDAMLIRENFFTSILTAGIAILFVLMMGARRLAPFAQAGDDPVPVW